MHIPLPHAAPGTPERYYTDLHCHCRNVIERVNGVLKERWRCINDERVLHYDPTKAGQIVNACSVLHNFCVLRNVADPPEYRPRQAPDDDVVEDDGEEELYEVDRNTRQLAEAERRFLIDHAFVRVE